jgi:hypothetical protein
VEPFKRMSNYATIGPNDFVSPPYLRCPKCGLDHFGVLTIADDFMIRRCTNCQWKGRRDLPPVTKRIVFLDQSALSNMVRISHPTHRREGAYADFWRRMFVQLDRLVQLQVIVCPQGSTHEEESALDSRIEKALLGLLRRFSGGVRFAHRRSIASIQVVGAALAWNVGRPIPSDLGETRYVLHGNVHAWLPHLNIEVTPEWSLEDIEVLRSIRRDTVREWGPTFDRWRQQPREFLDRFREEALSYGRSVLTLSAEREQRIMEMQAGRRPWDANDVAAQQTDPALLVLHALAATGLGESAGKRTIEFFSSDALLDIPFNRLKSMLYASLSRETQNGRKGPTERDLGTPSDFGAVSTSLPYCDAMFLDNKCAEYLGQEPLAHEVTRHECRVFSLNTGEEFLRYLAAFEAALSVEQRRLAEEIYGQLPIEVPRLFS